MNCWAKGARSERRVGKIYLMKIFLNFSVVGKGSMSK